MSSFSAETSTVQLKSLLQDRRWIVRNQDPEWGHHGDVGESEYDVVDDQEDTLDVHILPARPMCDETEYAGRQISTRIGFYFDSTRLTVFYFVTAHPSLCFCGSVFWI